MKIEIDQYENKNCYDFCSAILPSPISNIHKKLDLFSMDYIFKENLHTRSKTEQLHDSLRKNDLHKASVSLNV